MEGGRERERERESRVHALTALSVYGGDLSAYRLPAYRRTGDYPHTGIGLAQLSAYRPYEQRSRVEAT